MQKIRKQEESKGSRIVYSVFIGIAIIMVCINLYFSLCSQFINNRKPCSWEGKHMNGGGKSHERESLETDI